MAASLTASGLIMPASQSASGDANTLDDYEEGTWTPANAHIGITINSTSQYIKIGKLCSIWCDVTWADSPADSSQSGGYLTGIPFNRETVSGSEFCMPHEWWGNATSGGSNAAASYEIRITTGDNSININNRGAGYIATRANMASSRLHITGAYQATD